MRKIRYVAMLLLLHRLLRDVMFCTLLKIRN